MEDEGPQLPLQQQERQSSSQEAKKRSTRDPFEAEGRQDVTVSTSSSSTSSCNRKDMNVSLSSSCTSDSSSLIEEKKQDLCSICLLNIPVASRATVFPCHHVFHYECTDRWLSQTCKCAFCRTPVRYIFYFQENGAKISKAIEPGVNDEDADDDDFDLLEDELNYDDESDEEDEEDEDNEEDVEIQVFGQFLTPPPAVEVIEIDSAPSSPLRHGLDDTIFLGSSDA